MTLLLWDEIKAEAFGPGGSALGDRCDNCTTFRGSVPTFARGALTAASCACGKLRWASVSTDPGQGGGLASAPLDTDKPDQKAAFRADPQHGDRIAAELTKLSADNDEYDAKYLTRYPAGSCQCGGPAGHVPNGVHCRK